MVNTVSLSWLHQLGTTCGTPNKLKCCTNLNTFKHNIIEYFLYFLWLTDSLTDWLTNWLTDWLTDWLTGWLADWLTGWLADWLTAPNGMLNSNCKICYIYSYSTSVGLPTHLGFTKFEQQLCSSTQMQYH